MRPIRISQWGSQSQSFYPTTIRSCPPHRTLRIVGWRWWTAAQPVQGITYAVQSIRVSDVLPHLCVQDNFSLSVDDQDRCFFCIVAFHDEIVSQVITFLESYITLLGKSPQSTNNCCFIPSTSRMVNCRSLRFPLSIRKGNPWSVISIRVLYFCKYLHYFSTQSKINIVNARSVRDFPQQNSW